MKTKWFILLLTLCSVIIAEGFGNKEENNLLISDSILPSLRGF